MDSTSTNLAIFLLHGSSYPISIIYYTRRLKGFSNTLSLKELCATLSLFPVILILSLSPFTLSFKFSQWDLLSPVQGLFFCFRRSAYHLLPWNANRLVINNLKILLVSSGLERDIHLYDSPISILIILCNLQDKEDHCLCFRCLKHPKTLMYSLISLLVWSSFLTTWKIYSEK